MAGSSGASDAMHVRIKIILGDRQVHVDDMLDAGNVQAAGCHVGGNQDCAGGSLAKGRQGLFSLRLGAIAVNVLCSNRLEVVFLLGVANSASHC